MVLSLNSESDSSSVTGTTKRESLMVFVVENAFR